MGSDERGKDALQPEPDLGLADLPSGVDRRAFMMRSAVVTAAAVIAGRSVPSAQQVAQTPTPTPPRPEVPLSEDLDVVKKPKGR
jgi:L-serine dehydratase